MTTPRLKTYSLKEAAALLTVSRQTLWRAVKRKELKATRLGRRVVLREAEIERWLERRTR